MHQRAHGAVIEIIEKRPPGDYDNVGGDIIVPTAIRLNGQELLSSSDHPVKVHEASTFRLLAAAMPEIAKAVEPFTDPTLRDKAFDALVAAAQNDAGSTYGVVEVPTYSGYNPIAPPTLPSSSYDPSSTRVDNGRG